MTILKPCHVCGERTSFRCKACDYPVCVTHQIVQFGLDRICVKCGIPTRKK